MEEEENQHRIINGLDYPLPHPPLVEFLRANGLDENLVSAAFPLVVQNRSLSVVEFTHRDGEKYFERPDRIGGYAKHLRMVPLKSPPEAHGL